jgi:hypothetical protein
MVMTSGSARSVRTRSPTASTTLRGCSPGQMQPESFVALVRRNPANAAILDRLGDLGAPDAWLTAGCLAQTVWNLQSGRPVQEGIRDYDLFYHDPDLSWEAEDAVIRRAAALFADLGVDVEVRNQARVHLWFGAKFGYPIPPIRDARDGIDRFLFRGICIGIDASGTVYAPYGLGDVMDGFLRPNPRDPRLPRMLEKAEDYRARWPWLKVDVT